MANRMTRIGGWVIVAVAAGGAALWLSDAFRPWSFTESVTVEPQGYFFRFKASYTHGEEKIDFDYVAVCGYRTTRYKDGGKSNDGTYDPKVMIEATGDGGALMVRTPRACSGQTTTNGQAPADLLPFIVWFDDVNDLTFGFGYASPDAYDSPRAQVQFHGATIEASNAGEWQAWRDRAEAEYEQKGMLPGPWGWSFPGGMVDSKDFRNRIAAGCTGYIRLKLPDEVQPQVHAHWPAERPRYWAPSPGMGPAFKAWYSGDGTEHEAKYGSGHDIYKYIGMGFDGSQIGIPTRSGGGTLEPGQHYPADTFPILPRSRSVASTPIQPADSYPRRLIVREDTNGFVACGGGKVVDSALPAFDGEFRNKRHPIYVNEAPAFEDYNPLTLPIFFYQQDEYLFYKAPWR